VSQVEIQALPEPRKDMNAQCQSASTGHGRYLSASKIRSTIDAWISFRGRTVAYGFEEFRRDAEDGGQWTPVQYYSGVTYGSSAEALETAERCVPWLTDILTKKPEMRMRIR
jgi:hypothetical protein